MPSTLLEEQLLKKLKTQYEDYSNYELKALGYRGTINKAFDATLLDPDHSSHFLEVEAIFKRPRPASCSISDGVKLFTGPLTQILINSDRELGKRSKTSLDEARELVTNCTTGFRRFDIQDCCGVLAFGKGAFIFLEGKLSDADIFRTLGFAPPGDVDMLDDEEEVEVDLPDNPLDIDFPMPKDEPHHYDDWEIWTGKEIK